MKKLLKLSLIAITILLICSWMNPKFSSSQIDLEGKLFNFAEDLDKNTCNLTDNGNGSTIYFINDKRFVELWTETKNNDNDTIINIGTYKFNQMQLTLTYDSVAAKLDYYKKNYNKIVFMGRNPYRQYVLLYCKDEPYFQPNNVSGVDAYTIYGKQNHTLSAAVFKEKFKKNGAWKLLELE